MAKRTTRSASSRNSKTSETLEKTTEPQAKATDMGAPGTRADSMGSKPSEEEIRMRAYRRFLERGGVDGQDFDDWLEAERELKHIR